MLLGMQLSLLGSRNSHCCNQALGSDLYLEQTGVVPNSPAGLLTIIYYIGNGTVVVLTWGSRQGSDERLL